MAVDTGRVMAVDPGSRNIGLAVSDLTGTIASPLGVLRHVSRRQDAEEVARRAVSLSAAAIIVGQSMDDNGLATYEGRRSARFAAALKEITALPVLLWDESLSTRDARLARLEAGARRSKRGGHQDALAAAVILQSYLDAKRHAGK